LTKVQNFSQKIAFFFGNSQMLGCAGIATNIFVDTNVLIGAFSDKFNLNVLLPQQVRSIKQ